MYAVYLESSQWGDAILIDGTPEEFLNLTNKINELISKIKHNPQITIQTDLETSPYLISIQNSSTLLIDLNINVPAATLYLPINYLVEFVEKLELMGKATEPCHHYFDMDEIYKIIILSAGEYGSDFFGKFTNLG